MATRVVMPKMGYDMEQGKIVRWLKSEGDLVRSGEDIAEIETEKVNIAIQAFGEGVLRQTLVQEGDSAPVGEMIAIIGAPDEPINVEALRQQCLEADVAAEGGVGAGEGREVAPQETSAGPQATAVSLGAAKPGPPAEASPEKRLKVSPLASRLAAERGIDLRRVEGTGPGGRITRDDVLRFAGRAAPTQPAEKPVRPAPPAPARLEALRIPKELPPMRQAIARRMAQSKRDAPHFYVTIEIDMTEAMRLRSQLNEMADDASQISVNDLVVKAVASALQNHRGFNAHILEERIEEKDVVNVGVAIALPDGLVAPALMDCQEKGLAQIARAAKDLIARAKAGKLTPAEYAEATFTVSNLGMFDVESFVAIVNPPQVAILAVGSVKPTPVVREEQVVVAQVMKATLSADHRAVDGAQAARLLQEIKKRLQRPMSLLL